MYYPLERVTSEGDAAYLLAVAERIVCKDASFFEALVCPWTSSLTFDKLREIERPDLEKSRLFIRTVDIQDPGHGS